LFSPFIQPLESLAAEDLERLREVAEGWYVEYKSELSKAADIAKSISALANTYGGWLFYGVEEISKADSVAGAFPGIELSDVDPALQRIRQAVAQHMNPAAHYDARAVQGDGTSLSTSRAVICVRVPQSLAAPHVHASGRIYRRVADGSEPKAETDRHLLEQLFRRSDDLLKAFSEWVDRDPEFDDAEKNAPYLRLMMIADPWGDEQPWLETSAADLKPLFAGGTGVISAVPFDTIYSSSRGYVARQTIGSDPYRLGLTWRFRPSLVSDVYVPLNLYEANSPFGLQKHLEGYEQAARFIELLRGKQYNSPQIVDLNLLFNVLIGIVETQRRLLAKANWTKPYFIKARLLNVWRTVPFLDLEAVMDRFEADGLPMCLDRVVTTPPGTEPDSFQRVEPMLESEGDEARILVQALTILDPITRAWGLPPALENSRDPTWFQQLHAAGSRAMKVQDRKSTDR
jgi:hypothetical protein